MRTLAETESAPIHSTKGAADSTDEFLDKIETHKDEFYRFIRRTVWDQSSVEDVFSSAVLAVYENSHKYTPGTNFRAWMFRILLNKCFVVNRETKRLPEPLDRAENKSVAVAKPTEHWDVLNDPMKILDACGDEVYQAFGKLSMAQRACIMLKGVERFTYQEISDTLEIPVGTVMTHLSRGRAKLRKLLADYAMKMRIIPAAAEG